MEDRRSRGRIGIAMLLAVVVVALSGCGGTRAGAGGTVRIGFFPNLTHAPAMVAMEAGLLRKELGDGVTLEPKVFNAGSEAMEAMLAGSLDAAFVGPNPAINAYLRTKGAAVRVVSGATSGGAALVVAPGIDRPEQLRGRVLSSPEVGNTQDVALRTWLESNGLHTDKLGGGDVRVLPQANAQILATFKAHQIDGAWVPEPWASRLVLEAGGHVLVDEADLWPDGQFVTTHLVVSTRFLQASPDLVDRLLVAMVSTTDLITKDPARAKELTQTVLARVAGQRLDAAVLERAWSHLRFTNDPLANSLLVAADHAVALGFIQNDPLGGLYDLEPLNKALRAAGKSPIASATP